MDFIQRYQKLLELTTQMNELLQEGTDTLSTNDLLMVIQQRQDVITQISETRREMTDPTEEAVMQQLIRQIQSLDQTNYSAMEKLKQECSVKLNSMKQSNEAFDAYNPVSNEASAFFVDKKR